MKSELSVGGGAPTPQAMGRSMDPKNRRVRVPRLQKAYFANTPWSFIPAGAAFTPVMRTTLILLFLFLAGVIVHAAAQTPVSASDPRIAYMGRTEMADGKAKLGFPGITVRFVYRGPAPTLRLSGDSPNCYFNLSCNGWDPVMIHLTQGENEIALPSGVAPPSGWVIELVRRTESWMGTASFNGLLLPAGGELLPPPPWPQHKLMFIGDSLTCGEYDERFPPESDRSPRTTNVARSYGMLLAKWLNAQVHVVAYGGRGIVRDWSGKRDVNIVPVFFERAMPDDPASKWDHSKYSPDVIVINIGTDHDASILPEAELTEAYAAFVARVREVHPQAWILISESGFHPDFASGKPTAMRDALLKTLNAVAAHRRQAGDTHIRVISSRYFPGTPTDPHLVAFQQEQIALDFLGPIKEVTGW
jgi:Carbohydrate esterase 2 N-terminal/GDSL-like Lipase/Acylhydrolase family